MFKYLWKTFLLILWRISSFILWPYFRFNGYQSQWWEPGDPQMMITTYVLCFLLPFYDVWTDYEAGYSYTDCDPWFASVTILVTFLPAIGKMMNEIIYSVKWNTINKDSFKQLRNTLIYVLAYSKDLLISGEKSSFAIYLRYPSTDRL